MYSTLRFFYGIALACAISSLTLPEAFALTVNPAAIGFQSIQGAANPPSQAVNVSKSNNRDTTWTTSDSANWLTVSPTVGNMTRSAQFTVAVNTTGLAAGTYSATVTITVYKGGSASIPVTLKVTSATTTQPTTNTLSSTTTLATSAAALLAWEAVTSTDLAGYKVYLGTAPGVYGTPIDVGSVTSYTMSNLSIGTYYFVVTAYSTSGSESPPSNEVTKSIY